MKSLKILFVITVIASITIFSFAWKNPNVNHNKTNYLVENDTLSISDEEALKEMDGFTIESAIETNNLQLFLISGTENLGEKKYTTLSTAMDYNLVTVKETGTVNELAIDNKSDDYIFIHSGDIVKGGKQDRTMAYDVIIPPHAKNIALKSFCVEHGRWNGRGNEASTQFNSTKNMLSSRDLKMAAKYDGDQTKVWSNVATEQTKLNDNVSRMNGYSVDVKSNVSATSLQLTLESEELKKAKAKMEEKLKNILAINPNALGYAYAINGEIYGVDIYNNRALFEEIWPKIAESIIIEAISNNIDAEYTKATINNVVNFMSEINSSAQNNTSQKLNEATDFHISENKTGNVVFSTVDKSEETWVHKNYMKVVIDTNSINLLPRNNRQNINRQNINQEQRIEQNYINN